MNRPQAALTLAVASLFFTASPASAGVILSTNLDDAPAVLGSELVTGPRYVASSFATDAHRYILNSVSLLLNVDPIQQLLPGQLVAELWTDRAGQPGFLYRALASPGSPSLDSDELAGKPFEVTFGGNGIYLPHFAIFWVVLHDTTGGVNWTFGIDPTGQGALNTWGRSLDSGKSWQTLSGSPQIMRVTAEPILNPEPSTIVLFAISGIMLLGVPRIRQLVKPTPTRHPRPASVR